MIVFGDATLEPQVTLTLSITANGANVRKTPSKNGAVVGSLPAGTTLKADGRLEDNSWVRVTLEDGKIGWINTGVSSVEGDVSSLKVRTEDDVAASAGASAFYFKGGVGSSACGDVPREGLMIQTPSDAGAVELTINNIKLSLGSTAYLQFLDGNEIAVNLLEGNALVTAQDGTSRVFAGSRVRVPLNENFVPSDKPTRAEPYEDLGTLPLLLLPDSISSAEPLSQSEIDSRLGSAIMTFAASFGSEGLTKEQAGWREGEDLCLDGGTTFIVTGQFAVYLDVTRGTTLTVTNNTIKNLAPASVRFAFGNEVLETAANTLTYTATRDGSLLIQAAPSFVVSEPPRNIVVVCG